MTDRYHHWDSQAMHTALTSQLQWLPVATPFAIALRNATALNASAPIRTVRTRGEERAWRGCGPQLVDAETASRLSVSCWRAARHLPSPAGSEIVTCSAVQQVRVSDGAPWRCQVALQSNHSYLAEIERQARDVTLELIGPDAKRVVKVDSPTHRQGPELLFQVPQRSGTYTLVVDVADYGIAPASVELKFRALPEAAQTPLARGLTSLTTASAVTESPDDAALKRQAIALQSAVTQFQAARSPALEAEAQLRLSALYYWSIGDWPPAIAAAREAERLFDGLPDQVMSAQAAVLEAISLIEMRKAPQGTGKATPKSGRTPSG